MNTAVPWNARRLASRDVAEEEIDRQRAGMKRRLSSRRPFFHVLISVNTASAMTIGTQPPCAILMTFAREQRHVDRQEAER